MSNVIDFLQKMGQDAQWRHATAGEIDAELTRLGVDEALRLAIAQRDQQALVNLLGARSNVVCGLFPADDDEDEQDTPPDDDEIRSSTHGARAVG